MKKLMSTAAAMLAASLVVTGCSTSASNSSGSSTDNNGDKVKVVSSTDVYADIVKQVGGDHVEVTSLISSTSTDPHSYEATASDRVKTKDADLVVVNGGGYDNFLESMAGQANNSQKIVNAVKTSGKLTDSEYDHLLEDHQEGHHHEDGEDHHHAHEFNEHLWYDFDTMKKVSTEVAEDLAQLDSAHADSYRENAKKLAAELDSLDASAKKINGKDKKYISTEPVPDYLISSTGAENATPEEFAEAIEAEQDVPALVLKETKDMVSEKQVALVAYNEQTETSQTKEVLQTAKDSSVANVSFTETLPENTDYLTWMKNNVSNLEKALS